MEIPQEITVKNELNPQNICRACLSSEDSLREITEKDDDYETFTEIYKACTTVDLKEVSDIPLLVCGSCIERVNEFSIFREMCLQSHSAIQSMISTPETVISTKDEPLVFNDVQLEIDESQVKRRGRPSKRDLGNKCKCEICCEYFEDVAALGKHRETEHCTNDYSCALCHVAFTNPSILNNHVRAHNKKEIKETDMKLFKCNRCEKSYKTIVNLQIHVYSHLGLKPYKCEHCSKAFTSQTALISHSSIHSAFPKFLCCECGRGFTTGLHLKRHQSAHTGQRPYKCNFCSSSFTAPRDLTVHMRSHTGEKPYLCSTCGRAFRRISHLNVHKRIHTGEKPYKCSYCDRCFTQSGDWRAHERIHTGIKPYVCTVCQKDFTQISSLHTHMKLHNKVMFECNFCDKKFFKEEAAHKHSLVHSKLKEEVDKLMII